MAALTCEYADKIRFYDEVLRHDGRVFVPTVENLSAGSDVSLNLRIGGDPDPVITLGKVVAKLTAKGAGNSVPGVWIQLPPDEADKIRRGFRLRDGEAEGISARTHFRARRRLLVKVEKPVRKKAFSQDVSLGGVCLEGSLPVPVDQTIRMEIDFDPKSVTVFGRVAWQREARTGVEFRFQSPETRSEIRDQLRGISGHEDSALIGNPTVLIADDDVATLRALELALHAKGYSTLTAQSGPDALSLIRERVPAFVLLDLRLPGMNGLEVCRVLKRDAGVSQVPVALSSALPDEQIRLLLQDGGALAAIPKPFRLQTLHKLIDRVLDGTASWLTAPGALWSERREKTRAPLFVRCKYESATLVTHGYLREAGAEGGFFTCVWADPIGTQGTLTVDQPLEDPVELSVEVVHRVDWGLVKEETAVPQPSGFGVRFMASPDLIRFQHWLGQRERETNERPVVLLVDDDRDQAEALAQVLRDVELAAIVLDSPAGLVNAMQGAPPALILLDLMMPEAECGRVCSTIRASARDHQVPIWLHSSLSEGPLQKFAHELGADGYVKKGDEPKRIAEQITTFLRRG